MTTRRRFLGGLAATTGVAFCSCGMLKQAHAQQHGKFSRPVTVKGKRVKTIDVHAHCMFHESEKLMAGALPTVNSTTRGAAQSFITLEERIAMMDAGAVDMEILSVNPSWYAKDRDLAAEVVRIDNEQLSALCAAAPDRFGAFAALTLQFPDLAVQQLETAMKKQGLLGAAIGTNVAGVPFSDPKFHPVWAKAEELGAVLFIHPQGVPELAEQVKGNGWMMVSVAYPAETSITLAHLIFEGILDRFPKLKIIASHGGGYLPSYAGRTDHACLVNPGGCDPKIQLKKTPSEYLKQLYFDALVFTPEAVRHLVAQVGSSQVMLGSDCPYPWNEYPVDAIMGVDSLSDAEKVAILGGNAARVFGMK